MQLVYVEWEDASAPDSGEVWVHREDAEPVSPHMFRQVGFVVDADLDCIVLTEAHSDTLMAPRTRIPLGMVRRWVDLDDAVKG